MCIIISKPAGTLLPRSIYENCFESNRDGAGFAYAEAGQIKVNKGYFSVDALYAALREQEHRELVVHFRLATHGPTDADNCHPWLVEGTKFSFAITHNGILDCPSTAELSDTGWFVVNILGPLLKRDPWFLDTNGGMWMLEQAIGTFNKLVVLRSDGRVYRVNEKEGTVDDGVWYSNTGYRTTRNYLGYLNGSGTWGGHRAHDPWEDDYPFARGSGASGSTALVTRPAATVLDSYGDPVTTGNIKGLLKLTRVDNNPVGAVAVLNKRGRKKLRSLAINALGHDGMYMNDDERIRLLRIMARDTHSWLSDLDDHALDREIVKLGFQGI